ncbi:MAG: NADP-dependent oxidoreductase [Pseudomonadota bacterium]
MSATHRQVVLAARPDGIPQAEHYEIREAPVPDPAEGEMRLRVTHLSIDPAMRGWVGAVANYSEPVAIGAPMRSIAIGVVEASRHPDHAEGETLCGMFGWQERAISDGSDVWFRHDPAHGDPSLSLGILGINGITAYHALLDVGAPQPGQTVVVSTAAGGVGSAVGQIARIKGCRTVGIAGGAEKVAACTGEFGYDAAIDYKAGDVAAALDAACPDGIDVYFDNTSGPISDAVAPRLALRARWVICGTASIAAWAPWPEGPRVERHILVKRARMEGFLLFDYFDRFDEARQALAGWIADGRLTHRQHVLEGLEAAPGAIAMLYRGENRGKLLVRL